MKLIDILNEAKIEIGYNKNITVKKDKKAVIISQTDANDGRTIGAVYIPLSEIPALISFLQS